MVERARATAKPAAGPTSASNQRAAGTLWANAKTGVRRQAIQLTNPAAPKKTSVMIHRLSGVMYAP